MRLFGFVPTGSQTSEKTPMMGIQPACEPFRVSKISYLGLMCNEQNLANRLMKDMQQAVLLKNGIWWNVWHKRSPKN